MAVWLLDGSFIQIVLVAHVFGIYKDIFVQYISGVVHFVGTLRHITILSLVFSERNYLWKCCIITDQVFGMQALEASFNIWLACCNSTYGVQYFQSDPKPSIKRCLQVCQINWSCMAVEQSAYLVALHPASAVVITMTAYTSIFFNIVQRLTTHR